MLHFDIAAPAFIARPVIGLAGGILEDAPASAPRWVEAIIHVPDATAAAVLHALGEWRIERHAQARVAIGDPTFAAANRAIERGGGMPPASGAPVMPVAR
jgi:hypothetical protein